MAADEIEKFFNDLPHTKPDLKKLEASLQEIITQLMAKKEYLENLEKTLRESQEEDLDETLKEIERIRIRIIFLIDQTKLYQTRLVSPQGTQNRDESDVQNFTALFKELNVWLTRPRDLVRERVDSNDVLEIEVFIKRLEDSLNECRAKLQNLVSISPRVQELARNPNLAPLGAPSLIPQLETLQKELTQVDQLLTDRLQALQEILNSFINRSREPSKPEPELAATKLNRKTKPAPIFVPQPVPAVRKEDALVRPDGSFTNVCSRVEETFSSFPSPRSTIESTFKPIEMSDPRSVHTKSSKHKKPPVITTETYDDPHRTRDERTPDNEYSAEQVSQKVFDFLEIDEPESLSLGDETIDSRASPIPNEEVIDLDSPRFEYYEEIKFKDPVLYGQTRPVEQHEIYETSDLPESSRRRQFVTHMVVDERGKPVTSTTTRKYYMKGVRDPQQVKEYKYVQLFDPNNLDETNRFEVSPYDEQPTTVEIRDGTRTVVRTIRRRIIRKVVIINGKETVTEEVVEEPVEENVSEYERPEITEIEDDSQQEPGKQFYVVSKGVKGVEKPKSETSDSSSRTEEYPAFDVKKVKSVLRPEAKEFTPSYSLSKSTDISLPQTSSVSSDTTKPTRFGFMIRDSPLDVSEHSLPEDMKLDDKPSEPTSNVIYISSKEEDMKGVRPQRKKKKKRKGEKDTEEPEKTGDDQKDTESLDSYEDESDEDWIEKDGKLIKMTKTIVVTKDGFEKGKSPSLSDSRETSKPKQESKDPIEEIEKMIIMTDDKTRKHYERKDDEKKPKGPTEAKVFVEKEKTPVAISSEKPVDGKPKDGKKPIEREAPEKPIPVKESKDKPKLKSEQLKEKETSPTDKETDKKSKDKKGKPDDIEDKEKPKTEEMKPKEQTPFDLKTKDREEAKPKADTKKKPEDDKEKPADDIKVVVKAEDRKSLEKEKLRPVGKTVTETMKFEQEPSKKGKSAKFFDITQFIEQEQQPTVDEPYAEEKGDDRVKGKSPESDKPKPEKPVKDEEPSKVGRPDEKDKTKRKKEKTPDKDKVFGKEVKSSQPEKLKDEEPIKVGQPKEEKEKSRPVDESKAPDQREQEPVKVSKTEKTKDTKEKREKDELKEVVTGKIPERKDKEPSKVSKTEEDTSKPLGKDDSQIPKTFGKDSLPTKEKPSKVEKPKDEIQKVQEEKPPGVSFKPITEVKVEELKPSEQDKAYLKDQEFKVGKAKDVKDNKLRKAPEEDETEPINVSKSVEHKTFPTLKHQTHTTGMPEEKHEAKPTKKRDKGMKEKTPEEDKSKPGKEISETLKFIQFGYRVSPEDERSQFTKPIQEKPQDKVSEKEKPIEVGKKAIQPKPHSEDDELLRTVRLTGRKEKTPDTDKPVVLGKAPEQPTETTKSKDHKDKKGKKPDMEKPDDLVKAPEQPKGEEPSKVVEKPVDQKEIDRKGKPTQKDKSRPSDKDSFNVTAFIEHEKPSIKGIQEKTIKPEERKPKDSRETEEKPTQPKVFSEDDELLRPVRLTGRKEKTPDTDKPVELGKAPEQPTETKKPKDDKDKKEKKPDKGKPDELVKAPEQPKGKEPSKAVEKPVDQKEIDRKGKPTQKDKSKPSDKDSFGVTAFIDHEKPSTVDTLDKIDKPEEGKPEDHKERKEKPKVFSEDDGLLRTVRLTGRKEKTPDTDKPVELGKTPKQTTDGEKPKDDKDKKGKKPDKDKPDDLAQAPEQPKSEEPSKVLERPIEVHKKTVQPKPHSEDDELLRTVKLTGRKEKTPDKDKPVELGKVPEQPIETEKPVDDKGMKGKKPGKGKPGELPKAPEEFKSEEFSKVDKPTDENDKDRKGKHIQKDKTKPLDKDTFDITEFIEHERPSTRDIPDKVGIQELEKPKDDKTKKEKTPDKDKVVESRKTLERTKDKKERKEKPADKNKPDEIDNEPEKPKPSTKEHEPQKVAQVHDDKDEITKDKHIEVKNKKEKTLDKSKPDEVGVVPDQSQWGEKPKDDKELKQKIQDNHKPLDVSKKPEQQKVPSEEKDISTRAKPKDKGKKEKTPDEDKSKPGKEISETLKFIQFGYRVSPEDERSQFTKPIQEKPQDKVSDKEKPIEVGKKAIQPKPHSEDDELLRTVRLTGRKEKTPDTDKPVVLGKAPEQPTETTKPKDDKDKKGKKQDKDKPEEFDKELKKPKPLSEDNEDLRSVRLTGKKEKTPDTDKPVELGKAPEQSTETKKPKDDKDKKGKKPDKDKPDDLVKAPEQPKGKEPSKAVEKPVDQKEIDKKGKPTQKDKSKPSDKDSFGVTAFIDHEKPSTVDTLDKIDKPEQDKPEDHKERKEKPKVFSEDDELLRTVRLTGRKEKTPDTDKPVELGKAPEQPKSEEPSKVLERPIEVRKKTVQPKPHSEDDELLRTVKLTGRKEKTPDKDKPVELGKIPEQPTETEKPVDDKGMKGRKPGKDKPDEVVKALEQPKGEDPSKVVEKLVDQKDKGRKEKPVQKDKDTFDITEIIEQQKPLTRRTVEKVDKLEQEKPKDQVPKMDKPEDITVVDKDKRPSDKDKSKGVKHEVVETITLTGERLPSKHFTEVTKLIEHEKSPVKEELLFKEDEPAGDKKKGKKEKTPDKGKTQPKEQIAWDVTKLIDHEKPQREEREPSKVGKPDEGKEADKTKSDKDKPKVLEKEVFGTIEFIQRENTLPEERVTLKTGKDTFGFVKTQEPEKPSTKEEPFKAGKDKGEKAPEKPVDVGKTTETKQPEPSKVSKPKDKERKEKTLEDPRLSERGRLPTEKKEEIEGKPREERDKEKTVVEKSKGFDKEPDAEELALTKQEPTKIKTDKEKDTAPGQIKFASKDEEPFDGDKLKDGKKRDKGRKEKTPEQEKLKLVDVFKPEEKDKLPTKEQEPSALGKPKDYKDKPAQIVETPQQPKTTVGEDKGKKKKTPDDDKSTPGKEISETLKFIQYGYRVSPEDEPSQVVKPTEDQPKEVFKGRSPDKDTTKHTIVKVIETTKSIQEPKDGKHSDRVKIEKEKTQGEKPKALVQVTENIKPRDTEQICTGEPSKIVKPEPSKGLKGEEPSQVDKPKEEKDKTKKDKPREDKSRPATTEPIESVKSPGEERIPEKRTEEKTPEDKVFGRGKVDEFRTTKHDKLPSWKDEEPKLKDDKTRKDKPVDEKEKTPEKVKVKADQPLEKEKSATIQKGGVDVITFIQHEKSPVSDREPLVPKDAKGKKDTPEDKDKTKEPSLGKDLTVTTKFIEGEKPVIDDKPIDKKDKKRKEKIRDEGKPKTPVTTMEEDLSKQVKPKDVKEKDDKNKEKIPVTSKSQEEEKPKDQGRKEKTPDKDETSDVGKVQEEPKLFSKEPVGKDDKERTGKAPTEVETISAADKLPGKKQEPSKPVKKDDKVERTLDNDKPLELNKKLETPKPSSEKTEPQMIGQLQDDKEKGKVVTATLKFIQQETYPSQQDEPSEVSKYVLDKPKTISKEKSPAKDTTKHVIVQITEKIKDELVPFEGQEPSKADISEEEKDKGQKRKPTQKDKSKPSDKDGFNVTAFIEHEEPSTKDIQDKTTKPEERKPKDSRETEEKPTQPKVFSEDDELLRPVRLTGRKEKTPDTDKPVELGKAPEQPTETKKPKDDKDKKEKKPDKGKPDELVKAPEQPKGKEPSKVTEKQVDQKEIDRKGKPTQKDQSKPSDKDSFGVTAFIDHEKPSTVDTLDKIEKPEEGKPEDHKERKEKPKVFSEDDELLRTVRLTGRKEKTPDTDKPVELGKTPKQTTDGEKPKDDKDKKGKKSDKDKPEELAKAPEQPKQVEKPKDDKERKENKPDTQLEMGKKPEKVKLLPEDDELLKFVRPTGRKEKAPDTDKPIDLGKAPEQPSEIGKPEDKHKKEKKPDKDEPHKFGRLQDDKEKDKKRKDKAPEKDKPVEVAEKPKEQKLTSEGEQFKVGKLKDKEKKEKTPDEEKRKPEKMATLKFIEQETSPSQEDETSKEPKGVEPAEKDRGLKGTTSKFGVDTFETTKLIEHEKPDSKKPDSLTFKIVTQGYDEKGEPIKEDDKKKPGETAPEYETTKDGQTTKVVSFKKDEYPEDDESQKTEKKKPEHDDSKPSQKRSIENEADKRREKERKDKLPEDVDKTKGKRVQTPEETEDRQNEPVTGVISVIGKEPEKGEDKRVREVLIGKDGKPKPAPEDTKLSFASIVRKGERKTPEMTIEKPDESEPVKGKKKDRKPKSTTKHDEALSTEEEEEKTPEPEIIEKEDQPTDDQTSLTGTIVSMTKKFFGLPFGGRKESKPETAKQEEGTEPSSKPQKEDKASKKKDKKKEREEGADKPTEREPSKVLTAKEKKPEPVEKGKTVSVHRGVSDEPEGKQPESSKSILFPDKPSETQPRHGVIPAPVDKKPEADAFGKLVHKSQKPEKSPEPDQRRSKPTEPTAPTYADLFTQTSTPETSPRDTDKVHKTSQTKEYQTTEEGIQTEDDRGKVSVREYRVHVCKDEEPDDGKQTTEKYQQTSKPQSPTVTTTTVSSQTSPQVISPEDRDSKRKEKVIRAKFMDNKSGEPEDEEDEDEEFESRKPGEEIVKTQLTRPGEQKPEKGRDEPFGVYVKAKVSVTPTDVPSKSKKEDKKERKRKWKGETGQEDEPPGDIEVTGVVSVDSPKDLIESETQSWRVVSTQQPETSVNVKKGEKFVTDFLEGERAALDTTKDDSKDPKGKKDKKSKKPIKDREDEFRLREREDKGVPTRKESSPSSESDEPRDGDEKYDVDVNVRVAGDKKGKRTGSKHRPESEVDINAGITLDPSEERKVRREKGTKPEDDDKYKVSIDVKVKSGETPPKTPGKTQDIGTNVPSPEAPLEPEDLNLYLEKAKTLGKDRSKKMQNMKNNKRGFTWIIPSSRFVQREPVRTNTKDIDDSVDKLRDAIARRDYILIQRIFVYLIKDIDDWLELVEYRIRLNRGNPNEGPNQDKVNELRYLNDEIDGVGRNVRELLKVIKDVPTSDKSDIIDQLRTYVEQLEPQIKEIQETTEMEKDNAVKDLSRWEEFLNGVNNLSVIVTENRNNLERVLDSDGSTSSKLEELEKIELANREYMDRALKLIALAKDLANDFPNQEIPSETYTTLETTKIVQNNLDSERDRLLQLLSLADEYEQTLKEFAQVTEVADNLVESPITITSLQHLQDEMQKHRKFFVNLSHCRAILESLESNLDDETRGLYNNLHTKLHAKASSILDKAASRAQQMAMAASKWTILDKGVRNEQQWLQVAHQRLPDLQQVKSTDYDQYISLYQSLASDTAMHHAKILQLMDVANNLQDIITCVGLERFYDDYLNVILKLQEEIRMSLEKLLAFQDMWTLYEIMTKKLDAWMKATEEELKTLKAAPDRAKMRQFWELKAQYEVHNRLKQEMGNNFEKAVQFLPIADEMYQRQILGKLEDRWKTLEKEIKGIQESAMATLSAPDRPVNEKLKLLEDELNELNDTVNDLHGIIKTDEELNLYIERLQVLNERLDTIQEELGRLGLLPATESEKVGYLLGLARGLEQQLLEELNQSNCLREKLLALQKGLERTKRNQNSIMGMLDQCGAAQSMGSEVVEQAVKTCENVSADLSDQWQDMMDLRKVLHNLPMKLRLSVSPIGVEREFSQLQEIHTVLEERCASLLHLLRHRLSLWKKFEKQLEKVQQNLEDTDYMVELLTLQGSVDFDRLQTATDRLKDLHDSVAEREDLIRELKELADPLVSSCDPEVASQINAQVDETVTAWNDTRKNLYHIVDKYKDAVKLWKNYREGRDDIRKWIDQQWGALDILQDKPEEAVQHIKECKETLANQKARLDELKKLVAQIAADIGLDPGSFLECEVEDLGKRLEDVKDTLTTLTSVAESNSQGKDDCKDELVKAKKFLGSVQKSLNVVGEDGNTLSTLRDHLLALTKTESQVQNVKERSIKMNEKPHEIRNETSVVEILELWQQVFQETFQQYYRLSAKLVKSQDGAAALQLWQEYLRHVQTFLAGSLPEDYDGLRETQRLCEVHQNLLTSQQSVLMSRKDDPGIRDFSQALQEQFNSLANLHNETLARIMDRHNEVNKRLKLWDTYRHDQSKLLSWLRDMTRDQSRLQLRYIHLRRLPKLLEQIDVLLSRIPQGKAQIQEQKKQQEDIVKFCDEALATSIKMESVATAERINNIEASLKSWKDFLNRVEDLHKNYESELEKVEKVCDEITSELSSPAPVSFSAIQSRLDLCRDLKRRISELSKNVEEANVTYDQLKECLSPYDMKMLSQRLWLIGQRQGDLEHHLLLQILWLEDRLETQQAFNRRQGRFVTWAKDLIKRFDKNSSADPTNKFLDLETLAKRLETEVEIELNLKNREYNALHAMANNIIDLSKEDAAQEKGKIMPKGQNRIDYEIMKSDVEKKIKEVDELWDQLKNLKCARLERKSKLTTTMNDLWKRMEDIKLWLISVEKKLEAPNVIEKSNKKCIDKLLKDHEAIQENIEKQSGNVGEVLNLCELFLGDPAVDVSGIDTNEFESAQQALEKRWKAVCLSSTERKNRILGAWELLLELSKICKEQEKWLNDREKALQNLSNQADNLKLSDVQKMLGLLEKEKQELESKSPALKILDASYSKLAQESRLPADNIKQLAGPAKAMISKWHNLNGKWKNVWDKISRINKLRDDFIKCHNGSIVLLTNISAKLMQAELIPNSKKRLKKVAELEKELERESGVLRKADETGLELMRTCPEDQNVSATQKMVDEYQIMWKELRDRFADAKKKSLENVESKEIQVSTLAFETDSEVQVDTLPHMDRLTSRDAYGFELDVALRECDQNLTGLEKILRSSEEEAGSNVPTHKALAKIIATCTSSVELVQHLNKTLLEDCGMNDRDARTAQVNDISARFQDLVARAREREKQLREASERGRLTCPICSGRNWQQLENDLWRLEQWIQYAEAIQRNRPSMPESIEVLEDVIQAHRELLIDLDSHKSIIVSLNIVGDHLADHAEDEEKARSLRERLKGLNLRWDNVCTQAAQWQGKLQKALIENPEFHDTIDDLFKWLEHTESVIRNSEPVDLAQDKVIIEAQYKKFKILSKELEKFEPRVQSLQEAAVQLLDKGGSARERLNALRLRLLGMRRLIKVYLIRLGAVLGNESIQALDQTLMSLSQEMLDGAETMSQVPSSSTAHTDGDGDIDNSSLRRGFRFLGRVFRASLPIQALMLLVLGAATLVPDEYYSCAFSNNARFQSYYPNGPPPI